MCGSSRGMRGRGARGNVRFFERVTKSGSRVVVGVVPPFFIQVFSPKSRHERIDRGTDCWVHKRGLLRHQVLAGQGGR